VAHSWEGLINAMPGIIRACLVAERDQVAESIEKGEALLFAFS
jgi:hypothetical protein